MSVFSIIRRSRQKAKEHTQKQAEKDRNGDAKPAYKHVPTHAAADALAGAPPTWRADDKPRIIEEHRRRSAMPSARVPRVTSGLSNVMYPASHASPLVATQRSYSYHGPQSWQAHYHGLNAGVVYAVPGIHTPEMPRIPSLKGKGVPPGLPRAGKGSGSVASSSTSISSLDGLVMKPLERPVLSTRLSASPTVAVPPTDAASALEGTHSDSSAAGAHRLHPRRQRRLSDASIDKPLSGSPKKKYSSTSRDSRPPPSTRGFSSIPPVPSLPMLSRPTTSLQAHSHSTSESSSSSVAGSESLGSGSKTRSYRSRSTPDSSVLSTGLSTLSKPKPVSVTPCTASDFVFPFTDDSKPSIPAKTVPPAHGALPKEATKQRTITKPAQPSAEPRAVQDPAPDAQPRETLKPKGYYPPKASRFTETVTEIDAEPQTRPARPTNWLIRRLSQSSRFSVDDVSGETTDRDGKKRLQKAKTSRWSIGPGAR